MTVVTPDLSQSLRAIEHLTLERCGLRLTPEFLSVVDDEPRELIVFGGWRASKSTSGAAKIMKRIPLWQLANKADNRRRLVWLVGPDYQQTAEEFRYLSEWNQRLNYNEFASTNIEGPKTLRLKGNILVETKSAANPERLGSVAPDFILACEAGQMSDETRLMLLGRAAEKRANIAWTGTIEDDESHARWAWYQELGAKWIDGRQCDQPHDCRSEHNALSLPSWSNPVVFPGGRSDPEILRMEREFREHTGSDRAFLQRIAGIPVGSPNLVYPYLNDTDLRADFPVGEKHIGGAGGIDYGTVHPSSMTVGHLLYDPRDEDPKFVGPRGVLWIRENWFKDKDPGDTAALQKAKKELSQRWKVWRWATDPNERYMARDHAIEAVSGSRGAREHRIGLVIARILLGKLRFDKQGPGIDQLYDEMRRVHRKKMPSGEIVLVRENDDRTASLEDLVELLDGTPRYHVPRSVDIAKPRPPRRRSEFRRIA